MGIMTLEGVVDNGQIRLTGNIRLPDNTKVYIVVPDFQIEQVARIFSPHLAHPEQAKDFKMNVVGAPANANL